MKSETLSRKLKYLIGNVMSARLILGIISFLVIPSSFSSHVIQVREEFSFTGKTMGTTYSVKIVEPEKSPRLLYLNTKIDSVLADINDKMSTYIPNSELSKFNKSIRTEWVSISADLAEVINTSLKISEESNGSFDITVGPLVNLWGFGPQKNDLEIPTKEEIDSLLKIIGYNFIELDRYNLKLRKTIPDIYCDLSAIAKGYGVDKVGLFLESIGLNEYMVEIGGEVRTKGKNKNNERWTIGISTPSSNGLQKILGISDLSVATSGDYFNYYEVDGVRYSHTIDPKTGKPITHKLASVTVIHEKCEYADGYATAIDVLGPEAGYEFALKMELPIFMILRENNGFVEKMNPQFEEFIRKEN
jgi:thiamine biosynthesis lipoprotein